MRNPHCGPNGFSPPAPEWMCVDPPVVHNKVPEPDVIGLLVIASVVAFISKRIRKN